MLLLLEPKPYPCGLARGKEVEVVKTPLYTPGGGGGEKKRGGGGDVV